MKKYYFISIILLLIASFYLVTTNRQLRKENKQLNADRAAFLSSNEFYITENEKQAASVLKLTLDCDELRQKNSKLVQYAEDLGIKLKRIESAHTTATEDNIKVVTILKDTVINKVENVVAKKIEWNDAWTNINGIINKDSINLDIEIRDTIFTIVHKVPHKFWFIKWGCKAIRQEVVSTNPHTKLTYNEYIELK